MFAFLRRLIIPSTTLLRFEIFSRISRFNLLIICLFPGLATVAQVVNVNIKVTNVNNQPVPFATIKATMQGDSTKALQRVTDSYGTASLPLLNSGTYTFYATSVSYKATTTTLTINGTDTITIVLSVAGNAIGNVVVTTTRPVFRQEDDKTIVDPENLASSSTNAYEILEKTPGLFVDQDGNIYLNSTTPSRIYINGREQKMSTSDIATMLKSLPPNSIASIEILRTPSARYDASGSGGIVNVVLKKGVRIGLTGSMNIGMNQGIYGNQFAGLNLNNSSGKLSTYINLQYTRRNSYDQINTDRLFAKDTILGQKAFSRYPGTSYYAGFGAGYQLNDRWELNYDGRVTVNRSNNNTVNQSDITALPSDALLTSNVARVENKARGVSIAQGVTSKYKIDSAGSEWTNDVSYTFSPAENGQNFLTVFDKPVTSPVGGDGTAKTGFHYLSAASNLLLKLPRKIIFETGFKTTYTSFDNDAQYFRIAGTNRTIDAFRTAKFDYRESIHSAYAQASKNIAGIVLKVGGRVENTNMQGHQLVPKDTSFNIHRTDFFPYVYLSRNLMSIMSYQLKAYLVYRRSISRPTYDLLNPFPRYIDQYLFETGNPSLRPQFTNNYEANISVDERPVFALGINDTKDIFTNVIYQADTSKSLAYRTYDNLGKNKETYFRILGAIPPGKRYFIVAGAQYNHNFYQGLYENKPLSFKRGSWSVFTYQTLKLDKLTQLSVNGFARFKGQLQFYELSSFGALNISINRQFLNKKVTVALSATDVLFTNNNKFTIQQGTINAAGYREADTRRFGLNIRYNFGLKKKDDNNLFNIESPEKAN